jgi:hypothetical protein
VTTTLPGPLRRAVVVVHVAVSVGWLRLSGSLLTLGLTARLTTDATLAAACYRCMRVIVGTVLTPVSLVALTSGLLLAYGRPWGLTRYWWIVAKLVLTLAAAVLSMFALPALLRQAVQPTAGSTATNLAIAPAVAVTTYTVIVALSILKPWGRIRG